MVYDKPIKHHYTLESVFSLIMRVCCMFVVGGDKELRREEAQTDGGRVTRSLKKSLIVYKESINRELGGKM